MIVSQNVNFQKSHSWYCVWLIQFFTCIMCRSNINSLQFNRFGSNKVFDNPPKSAMNHGPWIFWIIYSHESFRPWWIDSREAGVRSTIWRLDPAIKIWACRRTRLLRLRKILLFRKPWIPNTCSFIRFRNDGDLRSFCREIIILLEWTGMYNHYEEGSSKIFKLLLNNVLKRKLGFLSIWEPFQKCILCCFCLHWSIHLYPLFWNEETLWNQPITN